MALIDEKTAWEINPILPFEKGKSPFRKGGLTKEIFFGNGRLKGVGKKK